MRLERKSGDKSGGKEINKRIKERREMGMVKAKNWFNKKYKIKINNYTKKKKNYKN